MTNSENEHDDDLQWLMHVATQTGKSEQLRDLEFDPEIDRIVAELSDNEWDESKFEAFSAAYADKPKMIALLRRQLKFESKRARSGPFPTHLIGKLRALAGADLPAVNEEFDFSILFYPATSDSAGFIAYESIPENVSEAAELVRSQNEPVRRLKHTQDLKHCRINVTVELAIAEKFTLVLEFEFIDPAYDRDVSIQLTQINDDDSNPIAVSKALLSKSVTFDGLMTNGYIIEIRAGDLPFDSFRLRLTKGT